MFKNQNSNKSLFKSLSKLFILNFFKHSTKALERSNEHWSDFFVVK